MAHVWEEGAEGHPLLNRKGRRLRFALEDVAQERERILDTLLEVLVLFPRVIPRRLHGVLGTNEALFCETFFEIPDFDFGVVLHRPIGVLKRLDVLLVPGLALLRERL